MDPKVSICIPAYKQITILRKVLDSVLMQSFGNYEVIISDDSPNGAVEILLREFDFQGRLRYSRNEIALGSPANWNYAISLANGEYIKILHSDDFFTSAQSLAKYVELLDDNPEVDFAFSATEILKLPSGNKELFSCSQKHLKRIQAEPEFLFFRNVIGAPSATIYRRNINLEYDINLKWLVDVDFYMRILYKNKSIAYSPEPLICISDGAEGQITQTVINDKNVQVREHVILYAKLNERKLTLKNNRFLLYFKLLFNKYNVRTMEELNTIIPMPLEQQSFYRKAIKSVNGGMVFTRILVKFNNSWLNKYIFKMEIF
ncbi:MAG TPA: glycosyltransferase [Bacteroidia bacterium]|jgi:glycosyltransferase involved in cell wall biosynthesis|nr:glycosyltransferase [Bacteroidia bacterium]